MPAPASATVECISIYPIKSLDGRSVQRVEIVTNGGLAGDREYALFDSDGNYVNGKNDRQVHPIRASYDGDGARAESVTLSTPEQDATRFDLGAVDGDEAAALTDWLREWFGYPVTLDRNREGGFPDDTTASGPTIISEATIETVAGWFDDIDPEGCGVASAPISFSAASRRSGRITSSPTGTAVSDSLSATPNSSVSTPVSGVSCRAAIRIRATKSRISTKRSSSSDERRCPTGAAATGSTTSSG